MNELNKMNKSVYKTSETRMIVIHFQDLTLVEKIRYIKYFIM